MSQDENERRSLPASRAFVLQLHADIRVESEHLTGRIEHIQSGHAAHFRSLAELLTFITDALREADSTEPNAI